MAHSASPGWHMIEMICSHSENWQKKTKYWEKTCPNAKFPPQTPHELS
jgi:hypothetical protein